MAMAANSGPACVLGRESRGRRKRGEKEDGENSWRPGAAPGRLLGGRASRRWHTASRDPPRRCFASWRKKKRGRFAQRPLALEGFLGFLK
jgi:hypothetical protein